MKTQDLQQIALDALSDIKGLDIVAYDVRGMTTIADAMIICSGRSTRHVTSLAENLITQAKAHKVNYIKFEGVREGEWAIVDLADVVIHIMTSTAREFYNLEDLWEPVQELRERAR